MHQIDEQLSEVLKRTEIIKGKTQLKKHILTEVVTSVMCFAFIVLSVVNMPASGATADDETRYGSLILSSRNMGFIVVGVLAFIIGVCVTLLCLNWKKYNSYKK